MFYNKKARMLSASLCVIRAATCVGDCPIPSGLLLSRARVRFGQLSYLVYSFMLTSLLSLDSLVALSRGVSDGVELPL